MTDAVDGAPRVTLELAAFVAGARAEDLPAAVRREAARTLFNFVATALGGCRDPAIERLIVALKPFAGPAQATVIGRGERFDMATAAFVNGAGANVLDFDDTHMRTVIHPAAPIAPGLLAIAEQRTVSGLELLNALALGIEVACRLGNAISPEHYARGYHITSTCGVIGAAAAVAKLLGLERRGIADAMGIAATCAGGLVEHLGFMAKSVGVGAAARDGLLAAHFAQAGADSAPAALEGERGFLRVLGEAPRMHEVTGGLGTRWEALANTYKPYPCAVVLNPVIDAALELRVQPYFAAREVARLVVRGNPLLLARTDRPDVATGREARVSLQHTVAAAMARGAIRVEEYLDAAVADPAIQALRRKVFAEAEPALPIEAASIRLETRSGQAHEVHVREARGSDARPLSDAELIAKLRDLAGYGCPGLPLEPLIEQLRSVETLDDARRLVALLSPSQK